MAISRVKKWLIITGILLMYFFAYAYFLDSHYVWDNGSCAVRYYYIPLIDLDRGLFILLGFISALLVCYWLYRINYRKKVILAITFVAFIIPAIHYAFNGEKVMATHKVYGSNEDYLQPVGTTYSC